MRIIFLTNIPSPYQLDFFTSLEELDEFDFEVIFCSSTESDRQFTVPDKFPFKSKLFNSVHVPLMPKDAHYAPGLSSYVKSLPSFDLAVISGSYLMPAANQFRYFLNKHGIPWYYWGENPHKKDHSGLRQTLKDLFIKRFLVKSRGVLGIGSRACNAYKAYIDETKPVFNLPYAPNLEKLLQPGKELDALAEKMRREWRIDDPLVLLFSGSLTERKAPDILIQAFVECARGNKNLRLLFAGDGPLRGELENTLKSAGMSDRARFLGFLEGDQLRATYLSADLFVLPTRTHEGWGVVVQEALASGLPAILSNRVGSAYDLINEDTGSIFDVDKAKGLNESLCKAVNEILPVNQGDKVKIRKFIKNWSSAAVTKDLAVFLKSQA